MSPVTSRSFCRACKETYTSWRNAAGQVHVTDEAGEPEQECTATDDGEHDFAVGYRFDGRLVAGAADGTWWSLETSGRRIDVGDQQEAKQLAGASADRIAGGR